MPWDAGGGRVAADLDSGTGATGLTTSTGCALTSSALRLALS